MDYHVMDRPWMNWCRLCARDDHSNSQINVFLADERGIPLIDIITQFVSIDISNFNNLPNIICTDCYHLIISIINFNQRIVETNVMFLQIQEASSEQPDAHIIIKDRYNSECDFKVFDINPSENTNYSGPGSQLSELDELMIDLGLIHYNNIKDETDNYRSISHSDENSNRSTEKANGQGTQKTKYKSKKERGAENKPKPYYYCSECHKPFMVLCSYRRHMKIEHDIEVEMPPIICEKCGKEFKSISALKTHGYSHSERKLKCKYCENRFKTIQSLRIHEDSHSKTNYNCDVCGLKLNTKQTLKMHMFVHSDQRKYKCNQCGNEFKRARSLKNHVIQHFGMKPYPCDFCDRKFASGISCRCHMKKNHTVELEAQEDAGNINISNARDLNAVVETEARTGKAHDRAQKFNGDGSLEPIDCLNVLNLKSGVDYAKCFQNCSDDDFFEFLKPSSKEESDLFDKFFWENYVNSWQNDL